MSRTIPTSVAALLLVTLFAGCLHGNGGGVGPERDPSTFEGEIYDRAIGNDGFRIAGDVTSAGVALRSGSAAQLEVVSQVDSDADGAQDKASFTLDARGENLNVVARLRQMATADQLGYEGDMMGGAGHYAPVFGASGRGPSDLPQAESYLFASGMAQLRVNDQTLPETFPMFVTVNQGIRDENGQLQSAADPQDLEMHIFILAPDGLQLPGAPEGFLYYYFELVGTERMTDGEKAEVGADLIEPDPPNEPPVANAVILFAGEPSVQAIREGDDNVTVTFDASGSFDPDGDIVVFVWRIFELNRTGVWERPTEGDPLASGQVVEYDFTAPGPKRVELVIRDDRGALATTMIPFFIDQHRVYQSPEGNQHLQTVSGGPSCSRELNCFPHRVSMVTGATGASFSFDASGTVQGPNLELYAPGNEEGSPIASGGSSLNVDGDALGDVGTYTLLVWWNLAGPISYTITSEISYSPEELPEPGTPVGADSDASEQEGEEGAEDEEEEDEG